ncbi:DMT family transporter [Catenovulum maritimum]|uniref:Membrane protein n=1 Tax=Catenovulum maritimum TaxID=1513271 RepID=A0A0J8GY82_9ALTE|nr:DMT family transporter [Catenovulum maritimum]KMT65688.1 membrane protein [Catenovulum maritimum]
MSQSNWTSLSFLTVVLVWSTTPIAINWSSLTMHPILAVSLRMIMALLLGFTLIKFLRIPIPLTRNSMKLYLYSGLGLYGGMTFSYLSSSYISTGVMSLVFGSAPIIAGLAAQRILKENKFSWIKWLALSICLIGLGVISQDSMALSDKAWLGFIFIISAVVFFSFSAVYVKTIIIEINPLATTVGAISVALPMYIVTWLIIDGHFEPSEWSLQSLYAIGYLAVFGSIVSFVCYYFILQKLTVSTVSTVTLVTPVISLIIGNQFNNEALTPVILLGSACVLSGLALYLWGEQLLKRKPKLSCESI